MDFQTNSFIFKIYFKINRSNEKIKYFFSLLKSIININNNKI